MREEILNIIPAPPGFRIMRYLLELEHSGPFDRDEVWPEHIYFFGLCRDLDDPEIPTSLDPLVKNETWFQSLSTDGTDHTNGYLLSPEDTFSKDDALKLVTKSYQHLVHRVELDAGFPSWVERRFVSKSNCEYKFKHLHRSLVQAVRSVDGLSMYDFLPSFLPHLNEEDSVVAKGIKPDYLAYLSRVRDHLSALNKRIEDLESGEKMVVFND